jgi:hypothetical protein
VGRTHYHLMLINDEDPLLVEELLEEFEGKNKRKKRK